MSYDSKLETLQIKSDFFMSQLHFFQVSDKNLVIR